MERENDKNSVVLKDESNVGEVQIADDVVAMIASLAAAEVDGVYPAGNVTNDLMSKVGVKKLTKGVRVDLQQNSVDVNLAITMDYGYNIPGTCQKVQNKVKVAIENMTGLVCNTVNIRIVGVNMKKDK